LPRQKCLFANGRKPKETRQQQNGRDEPSCNKILKGVEAVVVMMVHQRNMD